MPPSAACRPADPNHRRSWRRVPDGRGGLARRPLVNLPGCPPLPEAIAATLAFVTFGRLPTLDALHRPLSIYGSTVHDRCPAVSFFNQGLFLRVLRRVRGPRGWCLYKLGCRGPVTRNACATIQMERWHQFADRRRSSLYHRLFRTRILGSGAVSTRGGLDPSAPVPRSEAAQRGQALFDDHCVYCHQPAGADLGTAPADVPTAIRSMVAIRTASSSMPTSGRTWWDYLGEVKK